MKKEEENEKKFNKDETRKIPSNAAVTGNKCNSKKILSNHYSVGK